MKYSQEAKVEVASSTSDGEVLHFFVVWHEVEFPREDFPTISGVIKLAAGSEFRRMGFLPTYLTPEGLENINLRARKIAQKQISDYVADHGTFFERFLWECRFTPRSMRFPKFHIVSMAKVDGKR